MFASILVAVTEDEIAGGVARVAAGLAEKLGARATLVSVVDLTAAGTAAASPLELGSDPLVMQQMTEAQGEAGRALLDRLAAHFPGGAETLLLEGSPSGAIVEVARERGSDLIVIGTHGRGGLGRLVLGSVAEGVLREAHCPVLVVPMRAEHA